METPPQQTATFVALATITMDEAAQTRVKTRTAMVREYAAAMKQQATEGGLRFPPIIVFSDGKSYWLADGFHRFLAARQAGLTEIAADVRPGTQRDALLHSISANSDHGLPRSRADRRKAVTVLLNDAEWSQWSDREIAKRCRVHHSMVSRMRNGASVAKRQIRPRKVERKGVVYEMTPKTTSSPPSDALGLPLTGDKASIFANRDDFRAATDLFDRLGDLLDRIAQAPAAAAYRRDMVRVFDNDQ